MPDTLEDSGRDPTLDDLLRLRDRALELGLRVSAPATVTALRPPGRVDVRLAFRPVTTEGEIEAPIECPSVPVWTYSTGAAYVAPPLTVGDVGLMVFADRNLGEWLRLGEPADPKLGRAHDLADGVFLPGGPRPDANTVPADPTALVLEGPLVRVGEGAAIPLALADALHAYLTTMITAAPVAPNDGGATFKAALLAYLAANPAAGFASAKGRG